MPEQRFSQTQQHTLLTLARRSIEHGLQQGTPLPVPRGLDALLMQGGACFVTLTSNDQLRGCIGSLEAHRPLAEDVCENAFASAFRDPRFPPVSAHELPDIHIEISVLTPLQPLHFDSEADLLEQVVPFEDGLVLEDHGHRGTFLPLVWEQLPDKKTFWTHLKHKAGLPANHWSNSLRCYRYHTIIMEEAHHGR